MHTNAYSIAQIKVASERLQETSTRRWHDRQGAEPKVEMNWDKRPVCGSPPLLVLTKQQRRDDRPSVSGLRSRSFRNNVILFANKPESESMWRRQNLHRHSELALFNRSSASHYGTAPGVKP